MKILYTLLYCIKQLVFKSKDDYDASSQNFNATAVSSFFLIVFLLFFNILLAKRVITLSSRLQAERKALETCIGKPTNEKNTYLLHPIAGITTLWSSL